MKELYTELASREPIVPIWAQPVAPGVLCPAHIELELRLHYKSHGLNELLLVDQLLQPLQVSKQLLYILFYLDKQVHT